MKPPLPLPHRQTVGNLGESLAANFLSEKGYHILKRNFRAGHGEIDIIARDEDTIVFVEVKTRTNDLFGTPQESVGIRKLQEIMKTSQFFMLQYPGYTERIDVISIALPHAGQELRIEHFENVTG